MTLFSSDFLTRISFRGDWLFAFRPVFLSFRPKWRNLWPCFRFLALRAESKRCLDFARHDKLHEK